MNFKLPVGGPNDQGALEHLSEPVDIDDIQSDACNDHYVAKVSHFDPSGTLQNCIHFVPVDGNEEDAYGKEHGCHHDPVEEEVERVFFEADCVQEPAHVDKWCRELDYQTQIAKVRHHRVRLNASFKKFLAKGNAKKVVKWLSKSVMVKNVHIFMV